MIKLQKYIFSIFIYIYIDFYQYYDIIVAVKFTNKWKAYLVILNNCIKSHKKLCLISIQEFFGITNNVEDYIYH